MTNPDELGLFLPTPLAGVWVNRWTFSPPPPLLLLSHLQSFVSLRYRTFLLGTENAVGGMGLWQCMPSCLPTITGGGTMAFQMDFSPMGHPKRNVGLQMDIFYLSSSLSSPPSPEL